MLVALELQSTSNFTNTLTRARSRVAGMPIRSIAMLPESFGKTANFSTFSTAKRKPSELAAVTLLKTDLVGRCVESLLDRPRPRMPRAYRNPECEKGVSLREKGRPVRASKCEEHVPSVMVKTGSEH